MATDNTHKNETIHRLTIYADALKDRLSSQVPKRFEHRPERFKEMIELDLKRTLNKIEKLKLS